MPTRCPQKATNDAAAEKQSAVNEYAHTTELYRPSELSRRKLSPTLATAHPDNAIGLVAQCELGRYVKSGAVEAVGRKFSHRPGNPATVGVVRRPLVGDTAGYTLRRPKPTPVSLISMAYTC